MMEWYEKWRVKINQNKSVYTNMVCSKVSLNNIPIPTSNTVKYLELNKWLTWFNHIRTKRMTKCSYAHANTPFNYLLVVTVPV